MEVFRITHKKWGGKLVASGFPARWNSAGVFVIYTAESRALACLENSVHKGFADFMAPFVIIDIFVPDDIRISEISLKNLPSDWRKSGDAGYRKCQPFGDKWIIESETAVLKVPSVLVPKESNYLLNPQHPDFKRITITSQEPFTFDDRIKKDKLNPSGK